MLSYCDELERAGLSSLGKSEEDGELKVFYEVSEAGDSSFVIHWKEESTTILMMENPVCFVPRWYLKALQYKTEEIGRASCRERV